MLGNSREALVEHKFEGVMVCPHDEVLAPKKRAPVTNRLDESDQLAFIGGELEMACCKWTVEECNRTVSLMKYRPEPRAKSVAINQEGLVKV
jgi:hypothetical protein